MKIGSWGRKVGAMYSLGGLFILYGIWIIRASSKLLKEAQAEGEKVGLYE